MQPDNLGRNGEESQRAPFWGLRTKLTVAFAALFVVVLLLIEVIDVQGIPFTVYSGLHGQQREEAFRSLNLIADLKKERLMRWLEERRGDTHVWASSKQVKDSATKLYDRFRELAASGMKEDSLAGVRSEKSYQSLLKLMRHVMLTYGEYSRIYIADISSGTILVSTDEARLGSKTCQYPGFVEILRSRDMYIADLEIMPGDTSPELHICHVIKDKQGKAIAALIMQIDTDAKIKPMLHTGEGLGESGEALLVNRDVRILTSLKHPLADGTVPKPLEYQIKAKPAMFAARGEEGIIETEDYRGILVLAAYRHIRVDPEVAWGMVVKTDRAELFAPLQQHMKFSFLIAPIGILVVVALTTVIARNFTGPILSLSRTAAAVTEGNLDARAEVTVSDEVGTLAHTFNAMLDRIQARTGELAQANRQLREEIAERKKAQETAQHLAAVVEFSDDAIISKTLDGAIISWNKGAERLYGYSTSEAVGKPVSILVPSDRPDEVPGILERMKRGELVDHFETVRKKKDGSFIEVSLTISPIKSPDGKIIGASTIARDITERKQAQDQLVRRGRLAVLGQLSGSVAHELRNPMGVISNAVYYLKMALPDVDDTTLEYLDMISSEIQNSEKIISDLLDLSRTRPAERSEMSVSALVVQALERQPAPSKVKVSTEIAEDLPPVLVDPQQIGQVLINLLSNACAAMPDGGNLNIKAGRENETVRLSISDTGCGMPKEVMGKIFEPLYTTRARGIGLGLSVSKNLVEINGGSIEVESKEGKGSVFTITLPVQERRSHEQGAAHTHS